MPLPFSLPSSLPGDQGATLERIADFCGESIDLLLPQFEASPRLHSLICSAINALDLIDAATVNLYQYWGIDAAPGVHLDRLGKIVGEDREGRSDVDYAVAIKTRVLINRSQGRVQDLVQIVRLFLSLTDGDTVKVKSVGQPTTGNRVLTSQNALPGDLFLRMVSLTGFPVSGGFQVVIDDGVNSEELTATGLATGPERILLSTPVVGTYLSGPSGVSLKTEYTANARIELRVYGIMSQLGEQLLKRLKQAKAAGVTLTQITMPPLSPLSSDRALTLIRASSYPEKNTTKGLSRVIAPANGGKLQHARG